MKNVFFVTGILFLCGQAIGQARDGTLDLQKAESLEPAASIYLPYSPDIAKKAFADYLSKTNEKEGRNAKNFQISSNTLIVKNNETNADMRFLFGLKDATNQNETVVYLKLHSSYQDEKTQEITRMQFDMQEAKDYLDNLAIAIKPYATELQLKKLQRDLSNAQDKSKDLITRSNKLEETRKQIDIQIGKDKNYKNDQRLVKRKVTNDRQIDENLTARRNLKNDIKRQTAALALLEN